MVCSNISWIFQILWAKFGIFRMRHYGTVKQKFSTKIGTSLILIVYNHTNLIKFFNIEQRIIVFKPNKLSTLKVDQLNTACMCFSKINNTLKQLIHS